jgi:hypothetical protein
MMNIGYYELQTLELHFISLDVPINIIKNTNGSLWKIKIRGACGGPTKEYNQAIYNYCPNIKYTTVFLNKDGTLEELTNIFIKCQHLEAIDIGLYVLEKYRDNFLDLLIKSAPLTLYKFNFIKNLKILMKNR